MPSMLDCFWGSESLDPIPGKSNITTSLSSAKIRNKSAGQTFWEAADPTISTKVVFKSSAQVVWSQTQCMCGISWYAVRAAGFHLEYSKNWRSWDDVLFFPDIQVSNPKFQFLSSLPFLHKLLALMMEELKTQLGKITSWSETLQIFAKTAGNDNLVGLNHMRAILKTKACQNCSSCCRFCYHICQFLVV